MSPPIPDILAGICADTRAETARRMAETGLEQIRHQARGAPPPRGFAAALKEATIRDGTGLIAEIKRASPSGGLIRDDFDAAAIARAYAEGGAACLSVLTDQPHFWGHPEHLRAARAATELPVLRKDFVLEPWQVYESRAMGADCILLIMAALPDDTAAELETLARGMDMDVLVEVHDRAELDRAARLRSPLLGINNRDLHTLRTDIATTLDLARHVPPDRFLVSESGIAGPDDLARLAETGARAFLIGESLLRQADIAGAVRALRGPAAHAVPHKPAD